MALRLRLHPGVKVKGEGFLAPPSRPEPRDQMAKFQAGLGPAGLSQPLALPHLPDPPWSAPCPAGPRAHRVREQCPPGPYSPLADMVQAAGSEAGSAEEKLGRAWGGKYLQIAHPRAHTRACPWGGGSQRTDASRRTPGRLGTQPPRGPPRGVAKLTASGRAGRGPPPGLPCRPWVQWPLGTSCPLCCDARRGFCPREQWGVQ